MTFQQKLDAVIDAHHSLVCVGLDPDTEKLPLRFRSEKYPQYAFNQWIVDQTHDLVCAYKPNSAFYEARGAEGIAELKMTCDYIHEKYPEIPLILDAKRGDIGNSNHGYITFAYEYLGVDAITLHPYLGKDSVQPFLDIAKKGCIILCRTSNPGSSEFQSYSELYKKVAQHVAHQWNTNGNCMLVVGATYPDELAEIRSIVGEMTLLVPGIGVQGGDLEKTLSAGLNSRQRGVIINAGRSIIFAEDPRKEAINLRDAIQSHLKH